MKDKNPKKRIKRNPSPKVKDKSKKLQRRNKEMSVRAAKRLWFTPRKKGRPSKEASNRLAEAKKVLLAAKEPLKRPLVRKKRGRPRLAPKEVKPKRPRGRPRKHPKSDKPKGPKGRPRKYPKSDKPKGPRGRPRKHPKSDKPKRPRGRPKKNPEDKKTPIRKPKKDEKAKTKKLTKKQEEEKKRKKK